RRFDMPEALWKPHWLIVGLELHEWQRFCSWHREAANFLDVRLAALRRGIRNAQKGRRPCELRAQLGGHKTCSGSHRDRLRRVAASDRPSLIEGEFDVGSPREAGQRSIHES